MGWSVEYFQTEDGKVPAAEWEDSLPAKLKGKVYATLQVVAETEGAIGGGKFKTCHGYSNLFETRARLGNDLAREFCTRDRSMLVMLHGLTKPNGTETPPEALNQADAYRDEYDSTKRLAG
jgi:hypothetical protein